MTDEQHIPENDDEEARTRMEEFLYHQRRALEETGKALEALLPEGFRKHGNEASREFTKGLRVLVDAAVEEMKKANQEQADTNSSDDDNNASSTGKTKIKVEVD